ncbi:S41 family peptidase [Psychrobium sp. MM17-31]|uniref:S41 family peptidase n=1 Tax=Psychrobium sp. MM17-31 TaxID=2917758 RepID=UPI001EF43C7F|nr:S41 family peptidase [Psychrobium sp. MM17-31]MCG7531606.1 S41 family peptidase [Psychrobium sp. MM17-31]
MKLAPIFSAIALSLATTSISANTTPTTGAPTNTQTASQSKQQLAPLTDLQKQNLELLGRVWGFLKYHHPAVATGKYDWDKELIERLPSYLALNSIDARNQFLVKWIDELGPVELCKTCKPTSENAVLKPDHRWIYQTELPTSLRSRIQFIYKNRHQGDQHYIVKSSAEHPKFTNENGYKALGNPDQNHPLLTLFRFWNMIEYFSPHKDVTDKEWSRVLGEYIPKVFESTVPLDYQTHIANLISDLDDGHAFMGGMVVFHRSKGVNFPRFKTEFLDERLIVTKFYDNDIDTPPVLALGDEIHAINDVAIHDIVSKQLSITSSSTKHGKMAWIADEILRSDDQQLKITYSRGGKSDNKIVPLYDMQTSGMFSQPKTQPVGYKIISDNIGYLDPSKIQGDDMPAIKAAFNETNSIVVDLRNYPRFIVHELGGWLIKEKTPVAKLTTFNIDNPGEIVNLTMDYIEPRNEHYDNPIAVLVNENSKSLPEYTALALRATPKATVFGRTTEGSDGNMSHILLPGPINTAFSGIGVFYPDGKPTQRIGIIPDIRVGRTIEGIKAGKDEVLDAAIKFLTDKHKEKIATAN